MKQQQPLQSVSLTDAVNEQSGSPGRISSGFIEVMKSYSIFAYI